MRLPLRSMFVRQSADRDVELIRDPLLITDGHIGLPARLASANRWMKMNQDATTSFASCTALARETMLPPCNT